MQHALARPHKAAARLIRAACLVMLAAAFAGLVLIAQDDTIVAGPVTEAKPGLPGEVALARVGLPGRVGQIVLLSDEDVPEGLRAHGTWLLVRGTQTTAGGVALLEADRVASVTRPDPRDWVPGVAQDNLWSLIAAGLAVLVFIARARLLITAAFVAALGAALAWHGLHLAGFRGWIRDVAMLAPAMAAAGAVVGLGLGLREAGRAPGGLLARLAAGATVFLLLPWSREAFGLSGGAAPWPPETPAGWVVPAMLVLPLFLPALAPALLAALLIAAGHGLEPGHARLLLAASALVALAHAHFAGAARPYIPGAVPDAAKHGSGRR